MKTKIISIFILGLIFAFSCKKENTNPVLYPENIIRPEIIYPDNDVAYFLNRDSTDVLMDSVKWTPADYGVSVAVTYIVEADTAGNDFKNSEILYTGYDTSFGITQGEMNNKMINLELPFDIESTLDIRVASVISGYDTIYSDIKKINVTPYSDVIPLYLLGDATSAGWNNNAALEMTNVSTGVYEITVELTPSTGDWIKFIGVLGQWAPQWGTDATGTWAAGPLVYRPTEDEPDPSAIPAPPADGTYTVKADIVNLTYTVTAAK